MAIQIFEHAIFPICIFLYVIPVAAVFPKLLRFLRTGKKLRWPSVENLKGKDLPIAQQIGSASILATPGFATIGLVMTVHEGVALHVAFVFHVVVLSLISYVLWMSAYSARQKLITVCLCILPSVVLTAPYAFADHRGQVLLLLLLTFIIDPALWFLTAASRVNVR